MGYLLFLITILLLCELVIYEQNFEDVKNEKQRQQQSKLLLIKQTILEKNRTQSLTYLIYRKLTKK